jgi:NADH-quinone oxidoreductase subunit L
MPVTFVTMFIGTLAIAGISPLSGFFSKDEILFRAFVANKLIWVLAVATAMMTAFYMFRLIAMTFFGPYRGPAWEATGHASARVAEQHGVKHPSDPHAHGQAQAAGRDVSHGPADAHAAHDDHSHGHGPWHGPHESPKPMTFPLQALAVGAVIAGFVGIPAALGGSNEIEHFLEPSFTAEHVIADSGLRNADSSAAAIRNSQSETHNEEGEAHVSRGVEIGLMGFSVLIALAGIGLAWKFYVTSPEISEQMAERFAGAHRTLSNKYYVDELYNATVVSGTFGAGRSLWTFDRNVVDGAVNGMSWITVVSAWFSGLTDRTIVDGIVNLIGWIIQESSHAFRRLQTGLVQNYAMLMLFGIFAFVTVYLLMRP